MIISIHKSHNTLSYRILSAFIAFTFIFSLVLPQGYAQLVPQALLNLPAPGTMVALSGGFIAPRLIGVTVHPDNPLKFDFIVNSGDVDLAPDALKEESRKLIKYFLASLTVPEDELWVNLSPYEKDRMVPQGLGDTEMGRDMLAQDYLLKQLTASLMYPEKELGQKFWEKIYKEAREKYGTTQIPVNTFNKVWVVPQEAVVYEKGTSAYVVKSRLKVILEEDYEAQKQNARSRMLDTSRKFGNQNPASSIETSIIKEVILPAIEQEVNEGENFANLRQMYHSLILAAWYKVKLKDGLLGKVYVDQNKTKGIDTGDKTVNRKIYDQYIESFKKGVYNYIKEDTDPMTQDVIPRKYFSGGIGFNATQQPNGFKGILAMVAASLIISGASVPPVYATDMIAQVEKGKNNSVEVVLGENPLKSADETLAALESQSGEAVQLARRGGGGGFGSGSFRSAYRSSGNFMFNPASPYWIVWFSIINQWRNALLVQGQEGMKTAGQGNDQLEVSVYLWDVMSPFASELQDSMMDYWKLVMFDSRRQPIVNRLTAGGLWWERTSYAGHEEDKERLLEYWQRVSADGRESTANRLMAGGLWWNGTSYAGHEEDKERLLEYWQRVSTDGRESTANRLMAGGLWWDGTRYEGREEGKERLLKYWRRVSADGDESTVNRLMAGDLFWEHPSYADDDEIKEKLREYWMQVATDGNESTANRLMAGELFWEHPSYADDEETKERLSEYWKNISVNGNEPRVNRMRAGNIRWKRNGYWMSDEEKATMRQEWTRIYATAADIDRGSEDLRTQEIAVILGVKYPGIFYPDIAERTSFLTFLQSKIVETKEITRVSWLLEHVLKNSSVLSGEGKPGTDLVETSRKGVAQYIVAGTPRELYEAARITFGDFYQFFPEKKDRENIVRDFNARAYQIGSKDDWLNVSTVVLYHRKRLLNAYIGTFGADELGMELVRKAREIVSDLAADPADKTIQEKAKKLLEQYSDREEEQSLASASSPVEVEKVKEDVLAGIKEVRGLLEALQDNFVEELAPKIHIQVYSFLFNAIRAATEEGLEKGDESIPAARLFNLLANKDLSHRVQKMLAVLNKSNVISEADKQVLKEKLEGLQKSLGELKGIEDVIFQAADLDEQLRKVSRAFNLLEVNVFYALRNAVDKEELSRGLAGASGMTPEDVLSRRMVRANMIHNKGGKYILRPYFLIPSRLKKFSSGISTGLLEQVEKIILDSVDANNFIAGLAWDSRKSEEEIVEFLEEQKLLLPLADRWRSFYAQEGGEDALRETVERAKDIAGEFIKNHPTKNGEFVLAARVAPDGKSAVVTTAVQTPAGGNEHSSRILLLDLPKGDAGIRVLSDEGNDPYNSSFDRIAFFDEGVAVWNFSRQLKWDISDLKNPRPIGWQEEETWAQETSSSPATGRVKEIKGLLQEIDKERQTPGSGNLPEVAVMSDFHGGLNRFIMLLSDVLNNLAGFQGQLDPNRTIEEQLTAQGLSFQDIKGQIILGGDILDRGQHGIKIFLLIKELVEKGEGKVVSVTGNHDFGAFANLLGLHIPWYKGFQFYGDTEAENLIARYRQTNPELFDTPKSILWWTERLAEHNADQDAYQKKAFDGKVKEVRNRFIEDYKTFQKNWTDPQKDAMEKFIGYFVRIGVTDPYVGLNGLGKTSDLWWKQVLNQINQGYEARRSLGAEDAELSVWQEAIALAEKISREVNERLDQALNDGKWWYRVFESINTHAYRSVEWSAKDWSSHKGWGDSVIAEINEMIDAGLIHEEKLTQKNYIQSPTLQALARFYRKNFNLYAFTPYGDLFSHGGFPVSSDGTINILYKGVTYKGKEIFNGLSAVSNDVKDAEKSLREVWEALHLVNTWYADMTTELKPTYIKRNIEQIGIPKINQGIGVRHHVTGHNPIALGKLAGRPFMAGDGGYTHAFADFGMSEKYGGQGGWVSMGAAGIKLRGFESETSDALVDNPRTHVWDKETGQIKKTIENPGLEGDVFLSGAKEQLSEELARLEASSPVGGGVQEPDNESRNSSVQGARKRLWAVLKHKINGRIDRLWLVLANLIDDIEEKGMSKPEVVRRFNDEAHLISRRGLEGVELGTRAVLFADATKALDQWLQENPQWIQELNFVQNSQLLMDDARQVIKLIDNFMDVLNGRGHAMMSVRVRQVVESSVKLFRKLHPETDLSVNISSRVPMDEVLTFENPFRSNLEELLLNAWKYGDRNKILLHLDVIDNTELEIRVTNFGVVLTSDEQKKVFNYGVRLDKSRDIARGSGIGLFGLKADVESVGGRVIVESSEERGVTFAFTIPMKASSPAGETFGDTTKEVLRKFRKGAKVNLTKMRAADGKPTQLGPVGVGSLASDLMEGQPIKILGIEMSREVATIKARSPNVLEVRTNEFIYLVELMEDITERIINGDKDFMDGDILIDPSGSVKIIHVAPRLGTDTWINLSEFQATTEEAMRTGWERDLGLKEIVARKNGYTVWRPAASSPVEMLSLEVLGKMIGMVGGGGLQEIRNNELSVGSEDLFLYTGKAGEPATTRAKEIADDLVAHLLSTNIEVKRSVKKQKVFFVIQNGLVYRRAIYDMLESEINRVGKQLEPFILNHMIDTVEIPVRKVVPLKSNEFIVWSGMSWQQALIAVEIAEEAGLRDARPERKNQKVYVIVHGQDRSFVENRLKEKAGLKSVSSPVKFDYEAGKNMLDSLEDTAWEYYSPWSKPAWEAFKRFYAYANAGLGDEQERLVRMFPQIAKWNPARGEAELNRYFLTVLLGAQHLGVYMSAGRFEFSKATETDVLLSLFHLGDTVMAKGEPAFAAFDLGMLSKILLRRNDPEPALATLKLLRALAEDDLITTREDLDQFIVEKFFPKDGAGGEDYYMARMDEFIEGYLKKAHESAQTEFYSQELTKGLIKFGSVFMVSRFKSNEKDIEGKLRKKLKDAGVTSSPVVEQEGQGARVKEQGIANDEIRGTSDGFTKGGIDLNPALLDLQIKRDGNGVPLPLPQQPIESMHIEGFLPIIINITPVTNLPFLLGLADTQQDTEETRPAMKAREPEEISALN